MVNAREATCVQTRAGEIVIQPAKATDDPMQIEPVDVIFVGVQARQGRRSQRASSPLKIDAAWLRRLQIGLSPRMVQRRITRLWRASSNPVARCSVQRLSHTMHSRGLLRCV